MPTAKEKFIQSADVVEHKKWAESISAERACDSALLSLVETLSEAGTAAAAADCYAMIQGAKHYRKILLELHKPVPETKGRGLLGPNLKSPS